MKTESIEFDPTRLLALDRIRREARARQGGAYEEYQTARERRQEAQGRANLLRKRSIDEGPDGRARALDQAEQAEKEAAEFTRQMADRQAEGDAHRTELGRAGTLLTQCLKFAVDTGMSIPPELEAKAAKVSGGAI
ncbi:hypothetical protein ACX9MO_13370 [Pseudooceanicola sp. 502str34]